MQISDIFTLWESAHQELELGRSGGGSTSSEQSIGLNVSALSFIVGTDILNIFHEWEKEIRQMRALTPPALLKKPDSLAKEIRAAIDFALSHLEWSSKQEWISDYASEINNIYQMGMVAAKDFPVHRQTIACPSETEDGLPCGRKLMPPEHKLEEFTCPKCHSSWNLLRLMSVALADPLRSVYLDAEAIAISMGMTPRLVVQHAKRHKVASRNNLYNFKQFLATRPKAG